MSVALLIFWNDRPQGDPCAPLAGLPGLQRALLFQPAAPVDGLPQDAGAPALGLQVEFDGIGALEAASADAGALQGLPQGAASQQAFLLRRYLPRADAGCSYLVHYPGPAEDTGAWLGHYAAAHIPLMTRLPGIREVEMLTRIDWISALPIPRAHHMQRNRVAFDSAVALRDALHSPIRDQMRADVGQYPPYRGGMFHHAMDNKSIYPA